MTTAIAKQVGVRIVCELDPIRAAAFQKLIDRLDYESVSAASRSAQEAYDMILALQCLSVAMKQGAGHPEGAEDSCWEA